MQTQTIFQSVRIKFFIGNNVCSQEMRGNFENKRTF